MLELLSNLRVNLELEDESDPEDRELVMRLSPLYQQRLEAATQFGMEQERVRMITSLLQLRHGSLDEDLSRRIPTLATMSPEEYTSFILQVSREDLIAQVPVMDPDRSES